MNTINTNFIDVDFLVFYFLSPEAENVRKCPDEMILVMIVRCARSRFTCVWLVCGACPWVTASIFRKIKKEQREVVKRQIRLVLVREMMIPTEGRHLPSR